MRLDYEGRANIKLYNRDCMPALDRMDENEFDLAIVDPPYGISTFSKDNRGLSRLNGAGKLANRAINKDKCEWDANVPKPKYFKQLFKVAKNQIIWGGNYFNLPPTRGIVCWDKCQPWTNFSAWEMAWTNYDYPAKLFKLDNRTSGKIHPTQKPVKLYKWLLKNFAKEGDTILDTHLGSMSIAIACWDMGFDLVGFEIDQEYFGKGIERFEKHIDQQTLAI